MKQRRVVCAALRGKDGAVMVGIRHYSLDMHAQIDTRHDGHKFKMVLEDNQGFVDQWGVFMDRYEAYQVADAAGQVIYPDACGRGIHGPKLYSEGLY